MDLELREAVGGDHGLIKGEPSDVKGNIRGEIMCYERALRGMLSGSIYRKRLSIVEFGNLLNGLLELKHELSRPHFDPLVGGLADHLWGSPDSSPMTSS
jgi:hypothetical protein